MCDSDKVAILCSSVKELTDRVNLMLTKLNDINVPTQNQESGINVIVAAQVQSAVDRIIAQLHDNQTKKKSGSTSSKSESKTDGGNVAADPPKKKSASDGKNTNPNWPFLTESAFKSPSQFVVKMRQHKPEDLDKIVPSVALNLALTNEEYVRVKDDPLIKDNVKAKAFQKALFSIKKSDLPMWKEIEKEIKKAMVEADNVRKNDVFQHVAKEGITDEEKAAIENGP